MENVYIRRIQKTGRSTYIVSLPREWVEKLGLKKFDSVKLIPSSTGLLIQGRVPEGREETVLSFQGNESPEEVVRLFFSKYLDGYDRIRVKFSMHSPQIAAFLKERVRRWLVGVEIIGETATEMLAQVLPVSDTLPVQSSLERMGSITIHMLEDSIRAVTVQDRALAEDVIRRDDEVDRFYHFLTRQLNVAVRDYSVLMSLQLSDPSECINYVLAAKSIERAADHAVTISKRAMSTEYRKRLDRRVESIGESVFKLFESSLQSLLELDISKANQVLSSIDPVCSEIEIFNTASKKGEEVEERLTYLIVMNSLRRVAEYAADISEAAINISSRKSSS